MVVPGRRDGFPSSPKTRVAPGSSHLHFVDVRKFALALVAAALGTAPQSLCAQSIRGTVSLPDSSRAAGAIVIATGANGGAPAQALTNANGEYTLRLPGAGSYTLTVLRIGFRPMLLPPFDVAANETQTRSIVLRTDPVRLAQVNVTGSNECRVKPDSGLAVADAWNEARHALVALQLATSGPPLVVDKVEYTRALDATGRFVRDQTVHESQTPTNHAYISLPADALAARGYAIDTKDGTTYFAPDATVLLSESFAETHCLRLVPPSTGGDQLVGIGFEPTRARPGVTDITGTFWIDRATVELRSLTFHYTGVRDFAPPLDASGSVEFLRLPSGEWLVNRWRIHTPVFGVDRSANRLDARPVTGVRSVQESGGQVDRVMRNDSLLYRGVGDTLLVQLLADDVLARTDGATLKLVGTEYSAKADARGLVTLTPVIEGEYTARVSTVLTDSLGLDAVEHTIYVLSRARPDTIVLPKAREIIRTVCPLDSLRFGGGILRGTVRDERRQPLKEVAVTVSWKESVVTNAAGFGWRDRTRGVFTDDDGGWQMCGVPTNWNLVVKVVGDAGTEGRSVAVDANRPYMPVDLVATHAVGADSLIVATRALIEVAVVDPAGAPLSGAAIELSGPGASRSTVTGAGGRALILDIPPGQLRVRVKRIGFIAGDVAATVAAGRNTVPIVLSPTLKPALDTVRIVGGKLNHVSRDGFDTRRMQGFGTFVTADDLAKHPTPVLVDILARIKDIHVEHGVSVGPGRSGVPIPFLRGTSSTYCLPNVYVDGILLMSVKTDPTLLSADAKPASAVEKNDLVSQFADLALAVHAENLTGIEVYSSAGTIPAQFDRSSWNGCGSIVMWTR